MIGVSIHSRIGIGDGLQFSSLPENYFRATGKKLVDVSKPWFFDHNPFVVRDVTPVKVQELWNFGPTQYEWPLPRDAGKPHVYHSNAEIWAALFEVPCSLNRPRLYRFEDVAFTERESILFQTEGRSHGNMPANVIDHVIKKYGPTRRLFHIGPDTLALGLPRMETPTLWDLAAVISRSRMLIGLDSGPAWIAGCYPDVIVKKLRTRPALDVLKSWVPLEIRNIHSHWDDRCHQVYNVSNEDVGFTSSYRKI